jgi:hypothetical protein
MRIESQITSSPGTRAEECLQEYSPALALRFHTGNLPLFVTVLSCHSPASYSMF